MEIQEILASVDHTLLTQTATWREIQTLCDEALAFRVASVCIPPAFVRQARAYVADALPVGTVIGFPNGYSTTGTKCFEAAQAVAEGADELDMVIHLGWVKEGNYDRVLEEIAAVKAACHGRILKVIVEACLLTREEKIRMCRVVKESGADYIKTSTGFSTGGATFEDVALFAQECGPALKIKAAGGIGTLEDASRFLELGASRLGSSRIVRLAKEAMSGGLPEGLDSKIL